nr:hypothetical protein [Corallococcus interemptor]
MKRPLPDGTTRPLFAGLGLLRRVASLAPAPRTNLTRFHGVFAPGAQLRPFLVPQAEEEEAASGLGGVAQEDVRLRHVRLCEVWRQAAGLGIREASRRGASDFGVPGIAAAGASLAPA